MVDIGPQWIYDYADMLVYVLQVVDKLHDPKAKNFKKKIESKESHKQFKAMNEKNGNSLEKNQNFEVRGTTLKSQSSKMQICKRIKDIHG